MKKKMLMAIFLIFLLVLSYFVCSIGVYLVRQKQNKSMIEYCSQNNTEECYTRMFELMLPKMLIFNAQKYEKELSLAKYDKTPVWYSSLIYELSDAFVSFYSQVLHTPKKIVEYQSKLEETSSIKVYDFRQLEGAQLEETRQELLEQLDKFKTDNKKIVLKLDILNFDSKFFEKILSYSDIINGFLIFFHIENTSDIVEAQKTLEKINTNYVLIARNSDYGNADSGFLNHYIFYKSKKIIPTCYHKGYVYDSTMILSFVNKNLIDNYNVSLRQNTDKFYTGEKVNGHRPMYKTPKSDIHWVVTLTEIVKQKFKQWTKQS